MFREPPAIKLPEAPTEGPNPARVVERMAVDLATDGLKAAAWHGLAMVAEAHLPGVGGKAVDVIHTVARAFDAIRSLGKGDGIDVLAPIMVDNNRGLSLDIRTRLLAGEHHSPSPIRVDVGWDPFDSPAIGVPTVEAASEHGIAITACRAEIREATGSRQVDAEAIRQYVNQSGLEPAAPYVATYFDYDRGLGLAAVIPETGQPYSPLLFAIDRRPGVAKPFGLWCVPESWPELTDEPPAVERVHRRSSRTWSGMLDELTDRFDDPTALLVTTAVVTSVTNTAVSSALRLTGNRIATNFPGENAVAYVAELVARRAKDVKNPRAVRHALQEIIRWSLTSTSAEAALCRQHLANLLANPALLQELIDPGDDIDEVLLEYAVEGLEGLANDSTQLEQSLTSMFRNPRPKQ
jgi:hypothetical protein